MQEIDFTEEERTMKYVNRNEVQEGKTGEYAGTSYGKRLLFFTSSGYSLHVLRLKLWNGLEVVKYT